MSVLETEDWWRKFQSSLCKSLRCIESSYFMIERYDDIPAWRERAYCYELYHQLRHHLPYNFPYMLHGEIDKSGHRYITEKFKKRYLFTWEDGDYTGLSDYIQERYDVESAKFEKTNKEIKCIIPKPNNDSCITSISLEMIEERSVSVKINNNNILNFEIKKENDKHKIYARSKAPNPDFIVHKPRSMDNLAVIEVKMGETLTKQKCEDDLWKLETFIAEVKYEHGVFLICGGDQGVEDIIKARMTKNRKDLMTKNKLHIIHHKKVGEMPHLLNCICLLP